MRGIFITGTDTGVGKTTVGRALLALAVRRGFRLVPFKPVETGCASADSSSPAQLSGHGQPADALALWNAAGRPIPFASVFLHAFAPPVAPAVAAERAGVTIALDAIEVRAAELATAGQGVVVEGAGGLLTPYAPGVTGADVAVRLGLPVLVVARDALGTINHSALTLAELRRRGLSLFGLVLCRVAHDETGVERDDARWIERITGVRPLGTLPFLPEAADDALAAAATPILGSALGRLLR